MHMEQKPEPVITKRILLLVFFFVFYSNSSEEVINLHASESRVQLKRMQIESKDNRTFSLIELTQFVYNWWELFCVHSEHPFTVFHAAWHLRKIAHTALYT